MGESIVYALKVALAVAVFLAFMSAIITLISFIVSLASTSVIGEVIGLISIYLPFNPASVFASIGTAISAIIAFLVARKIFTLSINTYQAT